MGNTESIQPSENKIKNIKTNEIKNYDSKLSDSLEIQNSTINELSKRIDLKNKFINDYASWKGVQYRLGGDGRISKIAESISAVLLNLSVIVFLGFVMRAVLVFIRYYMQLGTDYENQRLAYILSKGDNNKFSDILYTLRENKINFEKTPSPPQEKIILSALELLKQKNKNG
ncbi:hypothetical protein [Pectobacterium brasiliense]|uniref:hypothetical protein n=1 Tax=Pectobacterium brasiliense TaxID=180957 RepID=UPI0001A4474B